MTHQFVPTTSDPYPSQTTVLDGTAYLLDFAFSQRENAVYLTVSTLDGDVVAAGMKLVVGWDLLGTCVDPNRPPGKLFVLSNTTDDSAPSPDDLAPGARCMLVYTPAADVATIAAGGTP